MNEWNSKPLQCVVLCAGAGVRMQPESLTKPKVMAEAGGRPILDFVVDFWRERCDEFIFVVGYKRELVESHVSALGLNARFVRQESLNGIAHALSLCEGLLGERFVLQLGDCLVKGEFSFPRSFNQGVGVWETANPADIKRSYSVELSSSGDKILRVKEKPATLPNRLCGMGTYFFKRSVFDNIRRTPVSPLRGEQEITDVLSSVIETDGELTPVFFKGQYLNATYPEDLAIASRIFCGSCELKPGGGVDESPL